MEKLDTHRAVFLELFPDLDQIVLRQLFDEKAKKDIKKAIWYALQPKEDVTSLIYALAHEVNSSIAEDILNKIMQMYCPNHSFNTLLKKINKETTNKLDTITLKKLGLFRRVPRKAVISEMLDAAEANRSILIKTLEAFKLFPLEMEVEWWRLDQYIQHSDLEVSKKAMELISLMPQGLSKSVFTFSKVLRREDRAIHTLSCLNNIRHIQSNVLLNILMPYIQLCKQEFLLKGKNHPFAKEFSLIRSILRNNGVILNLVEMNMLKQ